MSDYAAIAGLFGGAIVIVVLVSLAISVAVYVLYAVSHMKALKALGYDKPWMAWIPFANYYAFADSVTQGEETVTMFGSLEIPVMVYKLWWIATFVVGFIPAIGGLVGAVLVVVFLGNAYCKMYAQLEGKTEQDTAVIGYLSGAITLIAVCKFLFGKYE